MEYALQTLIIAYVIFLGLLTIVLLGIYQIKHLVTGRQLFPALSTENTTNKKSPLKKVSMISPLKIEISHAVRRGRDCILAIKQIGALHSLQSFSMLQPYWRSQDMDESYFSLYYSFFDGISYQDQQDMLDAILAASFSGKRKSEMIRRLSFSNGELLQRLTPETNTETQIVLIRSLNAYTLTAEEEASLASAAKHTPQLQQAAIFCLLKSPLQNSFPFLQQLALSSTISDIRESVAIALAECTHLQAGELLDKMMMDPEWQVRYQAAGSMIRQNTEGIRHLKSIALGPAGESRDTARHYLELNRM